MPGHLPISEHEDASQALKKLNLNDIHADTLTKTYTEWCKDAGSTLNCKEKAVRIAIAVETQELFCKDVLLNHAEVGYEVEKTDEKKRRVEEAAASKAKTEQFLGRLNRMKDEQLLKRALQKARNKQWEGLQMVREAEDEIYRLGKQRYAPMKLTAANFSEMAKKAEIKAKEAEDRAEKAEDKVQELEDKVKELEDKIKKGYQPNLMMYRAELEAKDHALCDLEKTIKKKIKKMKAAK